MPPPISEMPISTSKILDSALVLAVLTASLYFLGIANHQGDAGALNVPRSVLQGDTWSTVAAGGDGLLLLCLFPFMFLTTAGIDWLLLFLLAVTPMAIAIGAWFWRSLRYRTLILAAQGIVGTFILVFFVSYSHSTNKIKLAETCLATGACKESDQVAKVHIAIVDGTIEVRHGILISMSENYLLLLTKAGIVISPKESIRLVELSASRGS